MYLLTYLLISPDSDMWQSFAAIGQRTSEIWLPKEKKHMGQNNIVPHMYYKPVWNGGSGRPNYKYQYQYTIARRTDTLLGWYTTHTTT